MNCVAIDDEPIALAIISAYCKRDTDIHLNTYTNPEEGMAAVKANIPDLLFLDIEMNDYSGIELAREVPSQTILVFTTAHIHYLLLTLCAHIVPLWWHTKKSPPIINND